MPSVEESFAELAGRRLPLPGAGDTLLRWRALAEVAEQDLAVAKLYESHTDALAILAELDHPNTFPDNARWAVWAAEPPTARLRITVDGDRVRLNGTKAWCSGATSVTHGLLTGWDAQDRQQLVVLELTEPGITLHDQAWQAVGMGRVATPDLRLADVPATPVGRSDAYVGRPGFWHGGCGIAACWYGGAAGLAKVLLAAAANRDDPFLKAHLGSVDLELRSLRALLAEAAGWIDAHPTSSAAVLALRLRSAADRTARAVSDQVATALGAGPLCRDRQVAQQFADLAVFIRQTHGDRDLAELGSTLASEGVRWQL
jgi:alkylation response protein AidB-like acyl-CoA dehydrogenase